MANRSLVSSTAVNVALRVTHGCEDDEDAEVQQQLQAQLKLLHDFLLQAFQATVKETLPPPPKPSAALRLLQQQPPQRLTPAQRGQLQQLLFQHQQQLQAAREPVLTTTINGVSFPSTAFTTAAAVSAATSAAANFQVSF